MTYLGLGVRATGESTMVPGSVVVIEDLPPPAVRRDLSRGGVPPRRGPAIVDAPGLRIVALVPRGRAVVLGPVPIPVLARVGVLVRIGRRRRRHRWPSRRRAALRRRGTGEQRLRPLAPPLQGHPVAVAVEAPVLEVEVRPGRQARTAACGGRRRGLGLRAAARRTVDAAALALRAGLLRERVGGTAFGPSLLLHLLQRLPARGRWVGASPHADSLPLPPARVEDGVRSDV